MCLLVVLASCTKENATQTSSVKGKIGFTFTTTERSAGKSALRTENQTPHAVVVSVMDQEGYIIMDNQMYTLINFNGSYLTENIELPIGDYTLTGFNVVNSDFEIILSAPIDNYELAALVSQPLPIDFSVSELGNTNVTAEVLQVLPEDTPEQFGYTTFGFDVIETQDFYIRLLDKSGEDPVLIPGYVYINIYDRNYNLSLTLDSDTKHIRIPALDDNTYVHMEVGTSNFEPQTFNLTGSDLNDINEDNPFEVTFGVSTLEPTNTHWGYLNLVNSTTVYTDQSNSTSIQLLDRLVDLKSTNTRNYIVGNQSEYSHLLTASYVASSEVSIHDYRLTDNSEVSLKELFSIDGYIYGLGTENEILTFEPGSNSYKVLEYNANKIFISGNGIFAIKGNQLFFAEVTEPDSFNSLESVNSNLSGSLYSSDVSDIVYTPFGIFIIDSEGQLYQSTDNGKTFMDFNNLGEGYHQLDVVNESDLIIYGDEGKFIRLNIIDLQYETVDPSFSNIENGKFVSFTNVSTQLIYHFENVSYFQDFNDGAGEYYFSPVYRDYPLTDASSGDYDIRGLGISGNTLYLNIGTR